MEGRGGNFHRNPWENFRKQQGGIPGRIVWKITKKKSGGKPEGISIEIVRRTPDSLEKFLGKVLEEFLE